MKYIIKPREIIDIKKFLTITKSEEPKVGKETKADGKEKKPTAPG